MYTPYTEYQSEGREFEPHWGSYFLVDWHAEYIVGESKREEDGELVFLVEASRNLVPLSENNAREPTTPQSLPLTRLYHPTFPWKSF